MRKEGVKVFPRGEVDNVNHNRGGFFEKIFDLHKILYKIYLRLLSNSLLRERFLQWDKW